MESTLGKSVCVPGNADSPGADDDSGPLANACTNPAAFADLYNPAASDIGVLDTVVHAEEQQRFLQALATLSVEQRELLALKAAGELSAREIGTVLGKSEGAVRVLCTGRSDSCAQPCVPHQKKRRTLDLK